jgi:hypothetical protein
MMNSFRGLGVWFFAGMWIRWNAVTNAKPWLTKVSTSFVIKIMVIDQSLH